MKAFRLKQHTARASYGLLVIAQAIAACMADAALNSIDLVPGTGDGLITRDSVSGLDWLDHTRTLGRSFNDISSKFGLGGEFQGFRYATYLDANTLLAHAGLPEDQLFTPSLFEPALNFIALMGGTVNSPSEASIRGIIDLRFGPSYQFKGVSATESFGQLGGITYTSCCAAPDQADPIVSSWLVRAIPEPSICTLLGLGSLIIVQHLAWRRGGVVVK